MTRRKFSFHQVFVVGVVAAISTFWFHTELKGIVDFLAVNVLVPYKDYVLVSMVLMLIIPFAGIWTKFTLEKRRDKKLDDELDYGVYKSAYLMFKREKK